MSINDLGMMLKAKGDLEGAEALLREALEGRREKLGDTHPETLISLSNFGSGRLSLSHLGSFRSRPASGSASPSEWPANEGGSGCT